MFGQLNQISWTITSRPTGAVLLETEEAEALDDPREKVNIDVAVHFRRKCTQKEKSHI